MSPFLFVQCRQQPFYKLRNERPAKENAMENVMVVYSVYNDTPDNLNSL
jgi:hypothetical protein